MKFCPQEISNIFTKQKVINEEKWRAQILIGPGKLKRGPVRDNPHEAALDYNDLAIKYRGPSAILNSISEAVL